MITTRVDVAVVAGLAVAVDHVPVQPLEVGPLGAFRLQAEADPQGRSSTALPLSAILVSHLAVDLRYQHRGLSTAVKDGGRQAAERVTCPAEPVAS